MLAKTSVVALVCLSIFAALLLSSCGAKANSPTNTPPPSQINSVSAAIVAAQASGTIPVLNHDSTITGVDANGNGIRDDIEAYIQALPDTAAQKAALLQDALATANTLTVDTTNANALSNVMTALGNAQACLLLRYEPSIATTKSTDIEKITVNTLTRLKAYAKFSRAMNGTTMQLAPRGTGCAN